MCKCRLCGNYRDRSEIRSAGKGLVKIKEAIEKDVTVGNSDPAIVTPVLGYSDNMSYMHSSRFEGFFGETEIYGINVESTKTMTPEIEDEGLKGAIDLSSAKWDRYGIHHSR